MESALLLDRLLVVEEIKPTAFTRAIVIAITLPPTEALPCGPEEHYKTTVRISYGTRMVLGAVLVDAPGVRSADYKRTGCRVNSSKSNEASCLNSSSYSSHLSQLLL